MYTISREYHFAAAHRLEGHPKCGRLHGHNYKVTVSITASPDPVTGMLLDYGKLDELIKPVIDWYDHKYIVSADNEAENDPYATLAMDLGHAYVANVAFSTAECIAERLASVFLVMVSNLVVRIEKLTVDVQESEKSHASYSIP